MSTKKGIFALSPLIVFLCIYLVTSIIMHDFYKMPITVAFMLSSLYAVAITKGSINKRIEIFSKGAGSKNMMLMIWIFILAGAFASSAKTMGAVDATVNLALHILPDSLLLPGIFIAACFISLAIGTSVGTIAALTPVAVGIAQEAGINLPFIVAIVIGGAYFGDNLSFISDTTIIATQTQECKMSDKFKVNSRIVFPVAAVMLLVYFLVGMDINKPTDIPDIDIVKVLPYIIVIVTAVCGLNVLLVLVLGVLLTGFIGILNGSYSIFGWFTTIADGMESMSELIIMTLIAAGMLAVIRHNGGIDFIISRLTKRVSGKRSAEFCISALVCLVNVCTANNTVAIIATGPIANDIATRFGIDKRKSASLLDTSSCFTQGLLPYGAQMLIAAGLASVNPVSILAYLYYPMALGLAVVLSILTKYPRKYS
ncbi:MAG: Na+/H+ antiporter NhaC family protein [Bacteroides sp.]|nr:Na+/H+ antiporter NhaC family protein [Roseburia sp.]MCM1346814.1 Na+/H+ antiporter NhaC family protein [Bacteroides sp.]MCM1421355.1 Na+/H+ antiporter NhaC family protein [Bacteroides sp.]